MTATIGATAGVIRAAMPINKHRQQQQQQPTPGTLAKAPTPATPGGKK